MHRRPTEGCPQKLEGLRAHIEWDAVCSLFPDCCHGRLYACLNQPTESPIVRRQVSVRRIVASGCHEPSLKNCQCLRVCYATMLVWRRIAHRITWRLCWKPMPSPQSLNADSGLDFVGWGVVVRSNGRHHTTFVAERFQNWTHAQSHTSCSQNWAPCHFE